MSASTSDIFRLAAVLGALAVMFLAGCAGPASAQARRGDEIVIAGRLFHTGAPVVLWTDPGGYDAYRTGRRFAPPGAAELTTGAGSDPTAARYGARRLALSPAEAQRVEREGWTLDVLRRHVDQFVIHYDAAGTSRSCFRILHDVRGLSVHFMLDLDGTIYQTLDVRERAWHATIANDRSVGIEIANIGAYPPGQASILSRWYRQDGPGVRVTLPPELGDGGVRTPRFVARPRSAAPITGVVQGRALVQYDLTPEQYDSLIKLTAALCSALPAIRCDYPRDLHGRARTTTLPRDEFEAWSGLIGHLHIQDNKTDPGPAFDWEHVTAGARRLMRAGPVPDRPAPAFAGPPRMR